MKALLTKIYNQHDDHDSDIEMFRVFKEVDLLIEPAEGHIIKLDQGTFIVEWIVQDLSEGLLYLFEKINIPHYEFWSKRDPFIKKYLPPLTKEGWIYCGAGSE